MRRDMKKYFSKLTLAIVLALVMGLAFAGVAVASPVTPLADEYLQVGITKRLQMDDGTAIPNANFWFTFTQVVPVADSTPPAFVPWTAAPPAAVPAIANPTIAFPHAVYSNPAQVAVNFGAITWPHAGQFFFVVQEVPNTNPLIAACPYQSMIYDDSAFMIIVTVGNFVEDGVPTLRITNIIATELIVETPPTWVPGTEPGQGTWTGGEWVQVYPKDELEYRPGTYIPDPGTPGEYIWDRDPSQILFVNQYVYNRDQRPDNDDCYQVARLSVTKTVVDRAGVDPTRVHADLTTPFTFSTTLTVGSTAVAAHVAAGNNFVLAPTITAYVQERNLAGNWVNVTPAQTVTFTLNLSGPSPNYTGATYTAPDFQLTDNQRLRFPADVPAGTTVSTIERARANWSVNSVDFDGREIVGPPGTPNTEVTANSATLTPPGVVTTAGNNAMNFNNFYHWSPIMGLFIGSMPFMMALLGATVLLAMMVASRSRQRIEQLPIAY